MYLSAHTVLYKGDLIFSSDVNPSLGNTVSSKPLKPGPPPKARWFG